MNLNLGLASLRFASPATAIDERSWGKCGSPAASTTQPASALHLSPLSLGPRLCVSSCVRTAATLVSNSSETTLSLLC